jgi:predicted MFS family arabinose efflux permease
MTDATTPKKDNAGIWITLSESSVPVRAMLVGVLVNRLGAFFQTFLVLFLTHRGFTEVQAGVALGCYGAGSFLGVLAGGALADKLGPRWATLTSMTGTAGLLVVVLYVHNYPALLVTVVLVGVVAQLYRPAAATLLSELTPQHQQVMIFALYRLAVNVGTTAAPLFGALLIAVSYSLLFWSEAVAALVYAVIAALTLPRRPAHPPTPKSATSRRARGYRAVLADRRFVLYLLALLINSTVYIQYVSTLPLAMQAAGLATVWYSLMISVNGFVVITCELLVTKVTQRQPIKRVVVVGFLLLGGGLSIYSLPGGAVVFIAGTLVWTLAEIVGGPTMFAYPGMVAPEGLRGRYIGSMQTMFSLGSAIGPALGVAVYRAIGTNVWWCCGLACLVGMACALLGMRDVRDGSAQDPEPATEPAADPEVAGGGA